MAYRRPNDNGVFGSRWRLAHRAQLTACGVPAEIAASDKRWRYVLYHGDDPQSGWDETWLSNDQARNLLAFLGPLLPNPVGADLVERIQRRIDKLDRTVCRSRPEI
jgi:hypothetical protein